MTKSELISRLSEYPDDMLIMILDGFNGGGHPRDLNLGPTIQEIEQEDAEYTCDCENLIGNKVIVLGYGCY